LKFNIGNLQFLNKGKSHGKKNGFVAATN